MKEEESFEDVESEKADESEKAEPTKASKKPSYNRSKGAKKNKGPNAIKKPAKKETKELEMIPMLVEPKTEVAMDKRRKTRRIIEE